MIKDKSRMDNGLWQKLEDSPRKEWTFLRIYHRLVQLPSWTRIPRFLISFKYWRRVISDKDWMKWMDLDFRAGDFSVSLPKIMILFSMKDEWRSKHAVMDNVGVRRNCQWCKVDLWVSYIIQVWLKERNVEESFFRWILQIAVN